MALHGVIGRGAGIGVQGELHGAAKVRKDGAVKAEDRVIAGELILQGVLDARTDEPLGVANGMQKRPAGGLAFAVGALAVLGMG